MRRSASRHAKVAIFRVARRSRSEWHGYRSFLFFNRRAETRCSWYTDADVKMNRNPAPRQKCSKMQPNEMIAPDTAAKNSPLRIISYAVSCSKKKTNGRIETLAKTEIATQ